MQVVTLQVNIKHNQLNLVNYHFKLQSLQKIVLICSTLLMKFHSYNTDAVPSL